MFAFRKARHVAGACLLLFCLTCIWVGALAVYGRIIWPQASGEKTYQKNDLVLDVSHMSDGYIMAKSAPTSKKLKLRISKGDTIFTYDLNGMGDYEVFPLQLGSGSYTCSLYKNIKSNKYSKEAELSFNVNLTEEYAAFLCPSQYVNYTQDSPAVAKAEEICAGLETDEQKMEAIRQFMVKGFAYDYVRALTTPGSYLGDVDGCFETRMGLCQDLAAVAACMLRSQGVPTQLVIGYVDEIYHAWNHVLIDGEYQRLDITGALSGIPNDAAYTTERYY